jgi:hypothetical protein
MGAPPVVEDVLLISMGSAPVRWGLMAAVTIHVPSSKPTNIAAILLEAVNLQIILDFSKIDAPMLIVTHKMTQQA